MPGFRNEEEEEDTLFDDVSRMADRMGLQGDKRSAYIDDHMLQAGYSRVQSRESYARPEPQQEDQAQGNRWGFGSRRPEGNPPRSGDNDDRF